MERAYVALSTCLSLLGIWYLVFVANKELQLDWFRQEMFALRDELFDEAADGLIDFGHPAYGVLRSTMNGFIRYAHRISLMQVLFYSIFFRGPVPGTFAVKWDETTAQLPIEVKDRLLQYRIRMNDLLFRYLLYASPEIAVPFVVPIFFFIAWANFIAKMKAFFQPPMSQIDDIAYHCGAV